MYQELDKDWTKLEQKWKVLKSNGQNWLALSKVRILDKDWTKLEQKWKVYAKKLWKKLVRLVKKRILDKDWTKVKQKWQVLKIMDKIGHPITIKAAAGGVAQENLVVRGVRSGGSVGTP